MKDKKLKGNDRAKGNSFIFLILKEDLIFFLKQKIYCVFR